MAIALRFISGKYQGGEFPLEESRQVIVGRSSDLDMVLVDEMVSRKHARLTLMDGRIRLEDLDSTNGVFVNGERVRQATVGVGDRIIIGSNILRVVDLGVTTAASTGPVELPVNDAPVFHRRGVRRAPGESAADVRMSGSLDEIPLPDLLQLFGTSRKDGLLWVDDGERIGRIALRGGRIHYAQIAISRRESSARIPLKLGVEKAVYRMLGWESGVFELDPPSDTTYPESVDLGVQEVLMEAFRQKDELARLQDSLPDFDIALALLSPLKARLQDLSPEELEVFQLTLDRGTIRGAMDASPHSDLDTAKALVKLLKGGYLTPADE